MAKNFENAMKQMRYAKAMRCTCVQGCMGRDGFENQSG